MRCLHFRLLVCKIQIPKWRGLFGSELICMPCGVIRRWNNHLPNGTFGFLALATRKGFHEHEINLYEVPTLVWRKESLSFRILISELSSKEGGLSSLKSGVITKALTWLLPVDVLAAGSYYFCCLYVVYVFSLLNPVSFIKQASKHRHSHFSYLHACKLKC